MYENSVEEHHRVACQSPALGLASAYRETVTCKNTDWQDFEFHVMFDIYHKGIKIPLVAKLDAKVDYRGQLIPSDWKVTGYTSVDGVSPKAGYASIESIGQVSTLTAHAGYYENIPMQLINDQWATQLCTYGWAIGNEVGKPFSAIIDCLCWRPTGWRVARYIGVISAEYQLEVADRYHKIWTELMTGAWGRDLCKDPDVACSLARAETWF
jgi:hypothetical protein